MWKNVQSNLSKNWIWISSIQEFSGKKLKIIFFLWTWEKYQEKSRHQLIWDQFLPPDYVTLMFWNLMYKYAKYATDTDFNKGKWNIH